MNIDILTITPTSGEFIEHHFGENFNESLWIDFDISENNHWVGCFSKQHNYGINKVLFDEKNKNCCVVAGGKCYLLNYENKKIIYESDEEFPIFQSAVKSVNPNYYFLGNFFSVYILNENGLLKEIEPDITVDGIYLEYQEGEKIIGKVDSAENQYEKPLDITIDIDTLKFDSYVPQKPKITLLNKLFGKK